jgi:hypothetical protein
MTEVDNFLQGKKKHPVMPTQKEISQLAIGVVKDGRALTLPEGYGES